MNRIELFYDIVSPYSWFAFETLRRYEQRWSVDLILRPFFLNAVMRATEKRPPSVALAASLARRGRHVSGSHPARCTERCGATG